MKYDAMIYKMPEVKIEDIHQIYIGTPGKCMCGCSGNYVSPAINAEYAAKDRGYALSPEDISDKKVMTRLKKMIKNEANGVEVIDDYIFTVIIGSRQYTLYLKK